MAHRLRRDRPAEYGGDIKEKPVSFLV
jgi:hypothetical protein